MKNPLIALVLLSVFFLSLCAQLGSQAQTVPPTTAVPSVYLPVAANFSPTSTPTTTPLPTRMLDVATGDIEPLDLIT